MSRLAVVAKGTPVVLRTSVGALSRSSASRDGESGIIGIQNLYYATWFTKTPFQPNHSDSPKIHFLSRELFLCREYNLPLGGLQKSESFGALYQ